MSLPVGCEFSHDKMRLSKSAAKLEIASVNLTSSEKMVVARSLIPELRLPHRRTASYTFSTNRFKILTQVTDQSDASLVVTR